MIETRTRVYRNHDEYARDLQVQAADGWIVSNVTDRYPRLGCAALLLAPFRWRSLPPEPHTVVTYQREQR